MQKVTRSLPTFNDIMEIIQVVSKKNKVRVYLQKEVVEAANEAAMSEINEGKFKTPILIAQYAITQDENLLLSAITPEKEINFDVESEPEGEYHLGLDFVLEY